MIRAICTAVLLVSSAMSAPPARAGERMIPAVVYDVSGKFDKSFNEAAVRGAERFRAETGVAFREIEIATEAQRVLGLRSLLRRGATVIVANGFGLEEAVEIGASEFPDVQFCAVDGRIERPNVRSILFREAEGAFLVGMLAAYTSRSGVVGFVGGMDSPLIRRFLGGYRLGAQHANPGSEVIVDMVGTTPAAWMDPERGRALAARQFERGVDVIFAAAGATGLGVLQKARETGRLAIGVDSNQNHLYPGSVLTSMIKRVDLAVYECFNDVWHGRWTPGVRSLGLKEHGVDYTIDEHNRALISPDVERRVEAARADIIAGGVNLPEAP
jgi:basic membrane protein A